MGNIIRSTATAFALGATAFSAGTFGLAASASAEELNLYSLRQPFLIQPLIDAFTAETGTKVNIVFAKKGLLERIKAEGANSPADAVLTVDIGRLQDMVEAGVLADTKSETLEAKIPAHLRDPDGKWYGLTQRARVFYVSKELPVDQAPQTYEDLADPRFKGKICIRSAKNVYNVSMLASIVAHKGEEGAKTWLAGFKENLARKPQGNDRAQAKAIFEGICEVGIGNTYYYGKMATNEKKPEQKDWAKAINVVFPNQGDRGAHVNVSGAGVLKSSKNKENAIKLIEFLASPKAQEIYAQQNFEYPVIEGVNIDAVTATLGDFKPDELSLAEIAKHRAAASKLVDEVGFDEGPSDGS
ncbi:MAG: Fe(3+) ABC transporter substrate-binding protein [Magnetovibrionaceae bacterium]